MQESFAVTISSAAYGGQGVARHDGKVYFVDDALPGEQVRIRVSEDKGSYAVAHVLERLARSPSHRSSPCLYSANCGGCQWLEAPYSEQLAWKGEFIRSAFARIARCELPARFTVLPAPQELGYRNRVLLRGRVGSDGCLHLGFFRKGSREQVHVKACAIAEEPINQLLASLDGLRLPVPPQTLRLEVQVLPAMAGQPADLVATVHPVLPRAHKLGCLVDALQSLPSVLWAGLQSELKEAPVLPFETDLGLTFYTAPAQFQQVNVAHNHTLRRLILDALGRFSAGATVLDLFCGAGNLSLPLAKGGMTVTGVEFNARAIRLAQLVAEREGLTTARYISRDATQFLEDCLRRSQRFDLCLVDPPRAGMKEGLRSLLKLRPKHILYVSCDPFTLARDVKELLSAYELVNVTGLDFFPQTYHVETLVELTLKEP